MLAMEVGGGKGSDTKRMSADEANRPCDTGVTAIRVLN